jgi:transposase
MGRDRFESSVELSDDSKPVRLQRVEVITGVERRRSWPTSKKLEIVAESEAEGSVVSQVARRHGIHPQQLFGWRASTPILVADRLDYAQMNQSISEIQRLSTCSPSWIDPVAPVWFCFAPVSCLSR